MSKDQATQTQMLHPITAVRERPSIAPDPQVELIGKNTQLQMIISEKEAEINHLKAENTRLEAEKNRLSELTIRDPLTGLFNRRCMEEVMRREFSRLDRLQICGVSVLLIDIDCFKAVNDEHGHAGGDDVLVHVAAIMQGNVRPGDTLIRFGGDEFMVILSNITERNAFLFAERLRKAVASKPTVRKDGTVISTTISIGVASHPGSGASDLAAFLDRADRGMYAAKKGTGKNRVAALGK